MDTARFHPSTKPKILVGGNRQAESKVWDALAKLNAHWDVFYSARDKSRDGYHREVDFVVIWYNRIFYIEVKGGLIDVHTGAGPSVLWARQTQAGRELAPVDPTQLWNAKKALHKAIKDECGKTPREFGFTEYEVFIFPDTTRGEMQAHQLDNDTVFHFFAEDLVNLRLTLVDIVRRQKGTFVPRPQIRRIVDKVSSLALQADRALPASSLSSVSQPERARLSPVDSASRFQPAAWRNRPSRRFSQAWKWAFPWLCVTGLVLLYLLWPNAESTKTVPSAQSIQTPSASKTPLPAPRPTAPAATNNPATLPAASPETTLPAFIPIVALTDVEQAVMLARRVNEPIEWRAGRHFGFVTLYEIEGGKCLRHRVTRNDVTPAEVGFVRRC